MPMPVSLVSLSVRVESMDGSLLLAGATWVGYFKLNSSYLCGSLLTLGNPTGSWQHSKKARWVSFPLCLLNLQPVNVTLGLMAVLMLAAERHSGLTVRVVILLWFACRRCSMSPPLPKTHPHPSPPPIHLSRPHEPYKPLLGLIFQGRVRYLFA